MCDELGDVARSILAAIVAAPDAWISPAEVAVALELDAELVEETLADLDVAHWIEVWVRDEGPVVTLRPIAAERLGVKLIAVGQQERWRWAPIGEKEPKAPKALPPSRTMAGVVLAEDGDGSLAWVEDKSPLPEDLIAVNEEIQKLVEQVAAAGKKIRIKTLPPNPRIQRSPRWLITDGLPWPIHLFGGSGWRGLGGPEDVCGHCHNRPLRPGEYCYECDRWYHNQFRILAPALPLPEPKRRTTSPERKKYLDKLNRQREKEQRHAKRKKGRA